MERDKVCVELDTAKLELEKLGADLKGKADLYENLKKAYHEQIIKLQEVSSKVDMQSQELNERAEEISVVKQKCEDLQFTLNEKESTIRSLSAANDKLRVECALEGRRWEEERRGLLLAVDEVNEKNIDQEQKINMRMAKNEGLKGLLSALQKKCSEAEEKAKSSKELRERDGLFLKLEEDSRKVEDQLKWKKEQFKHLEEAHEKIQKQFRQNKKEWEQEKSTLINEICLLQTSLDSQSRISEDLDNRLKMCNQALAHEETRRKFLEVEVSELRARFENVLIECQEAKSQIECLTAQRDKEIATLRHALFTKETFYMETEYRAGKLEQENKELLASIRELQETQMQEVRHSSSFAKLQKKLKRVEQIHTDCSKNLKVKEAEWSCQLEQLIGELNQYRFALEVKETAAKELQAEVENCHYEIMQLKLQNEEASVMCLVLKSEIAKAHLNLIDVENKISLPDKEKDQNMSLLMKQLEMRTTALDKAQTDLNEEHQKAVSLSSRIESLAIEEQKILLEKELERYEYMIKESSNYEAQFKEQALLTESDLKEKLRAACDAIDTANSELAEEREKVTFLSRRVESLSSIEEKHLMMQGELEKYNEMLEESFKHQLFLEERALQIENELKEKFRKACDALNMANSELSHQHEETASLSRRVESLNLIEEQRLWMQKELDNYKKMHEESSRNQLLSEEKALQTETELKRKLQRAYDALHTADSELVGEREKAGSYLRRVESCIATEGKLLEMQKELDMCREMLEESYKCQARLEEEALLKENDSKWEIGQLQKALDELNPHLAEKICEAHAFEFELWIWKTIINRLKDDFEEGQELRKELEASLLAQVEVGEALKLEKDGLVQMVESKGIRIENLQRQVALYEEKLKTRESEATTFLRMERPSSQSEKESFLQLMTEKDKVLEDLQKEIEWLEQESLSRELEGLISLKMESERTFRLEKGKLIQIVEEKDQRIDELLQLVESVEQKFISSSSSFSSELTKKQAQVSLLKEAWEKIACAEILAQLETEEKKLMILELEDDIYSLQLKLESQGTSFSQTKQQALEIETELEANQMEMKNLMNAMETKLRFSECLVEELKSEKKNLVEDIMTLSSEKENLMAFVSGMGNRISQFSEEDMQLQGILEKIVHSLDNNGSCFFSKGGKHLLTENINPCMSSSTKRYHTISEERSLFRELN